jgi:hypothetical protein
MNLCPGSKNLINGKTTRYDRIINELCHFYKVSLIKTRLMFHNYHLLNQLQVFNMKVDYQKKTIRGVYLHKTCTLYSDEHKLFFILGDK